jgi:hypothetical protein
MWESSSTTLLHLLHDKAKVRFSPEVNYEINKHQNDRIPQTEIYFKDVIPSPNERSNNVYRTSKYTYPEYERRLWNEELPRENGNKGEKHNLIAGVDDFMTNGTKELIFVTDDHSALKGILNGVIGAFPVLKIWNSFDVVLYLYLDHKQFTVAMASDAISDIDAKSATNDERMSPAKTQERIKRRTTYLRYLEKIEAIKNR